MEPLRSAPLLGRVYTPCVREFVRVPVVPSPRIAVLPGRTDWVVPRVPELSTTRPIDERLTDDAPRFPAATPDWLR